MSITTTFRSATIAAVGMMLVLCSIAAAAETVTITFKVKPAPGTAADAKLYLAGDDKALGEWKADGFQLTRGEDGIYSGKVDLTRDRQVEYKVTRGSWETVEKNADGSEINNRTLTPTKDSTVEIEVKKWADTAKLQPGITTRPTEKQSTRTGDIRVHENFDSRVLGNNRDIYVFVPPEYDRETYRRYAVLYMHDGQNIFDAATSFKGVEWQADETATRLINAETIEPLIIVGIANTKNRMDEYTLYRDSEFGGGASGRDYMRFVVEEVKPFIDAHYRTRPDRANTGVGGSSLGATISLELCRAYPDVFGKCMAMSPALWFANYEILNSIERDNSWIRDCRFWMDVGTLEGATEANHNAYVGGLLRLESKLILHGRLKRGTGYEVLVAEGAKHDESAWAERFNKALTFLYPPNPAPYNPPHGLPHPAPATAPEPSAPRDVAAGRPEPQ